MAAIIFPPNPAGQTPVNTFSTTSTPLANTSNTFTYTWNGTAWTSAPAGGGGGSGTVTSVDVSGGTTGLTYSGGPITASGTITMAGTLAVANGGTGATTVSGAQANLLPAQAGNSGKLLSTDGAGVLSWVAVGGTGTVTNVTGTLPITVATGTTTPVIAINAATNASAGAIEIATLAEAATGTDATRALTPESGVPKDASGMTGAAILPSGTTAQQPAPGVAGMTRFNSSTGAMEFYDGSSWIPLSPKAPCFSAYTTANIGILTGVTSLCTFDAEFFDNFNYYNTATGTFQPGIAGYYQLNANVGLVTTNSVNSIATYVLSLYKNGSELLRFSQLTTSFTVGENLSANSVYASGSSVVYFNGTTDSARVWVAAAALDPLAILGGSPTYSTFSGTLVGV